MMRQVFKCPGVLEHQMGTRVAGGVTCVSSASCVKCASASDVPSASDAQDTSDVSFPERCKLFQMC
jgi:hypothetical protein